MFGAHTLQSELKSLYKSQIEESTLDFNGMLQKASKDDLIAVIKSVRGTLPASNGVIRKTLNGLLTNVVGTGLRVTHLSGIQIKQEPAAEENQRVDIKQEAVPAEVPIHSKYLQTLQELEVFESLIAGKIQVLSSPFETPLLNSLQQFIQEQTSTRDKRIKELEDQFIQESKDMMDMRRQLKQKDQKLTKLQAELEQATQQFGDVSRQLSALKAEVGNKPEAPVQVAANPKETLDRITNLFRQRVASLDTNYAALDSQIGQKVDEISQRYATCVKNLSDRIRILFSQLKAKNKKVKLDKEKIQQLQKQLETAQEALKERSATPVHGGDSSSQLQLEDQNLRIQKMVEEYEKKIFDLNKGNGVKIQEITQQHEVQLQSRTQEFGMKIAALNQEHQHTLRTVNENHQQIVEKFNDQAKLQQELVKQLQQKIQASGIQIVAVETEKSDLISQFESHAASLQEANKKVSHLEKELQLSVESHTQTKLHLSGLQERIEAEKRSLQDTEKQNTATNQAQVAKLQAEIQTLQSSVAKTAQENSTLQAVLSKAEQEHQRLSQTLQTSTAQLGACQDECKKLQQQLADVTVRVSPVSVLSAVTVPPTNKAPDVAQSIEEQKRILKEKREKKKATGSQEQGKEAGVSVGQPQEMKEVSEPEHNAQTRSHTLLQHVATGAELIASALVPSEMQKHPSEMRTQMEDEHNPHTRSQTLVDNIAIGLDDMLAAQVAAPSPRHAQQKVPAQAAWEAPRAFFEEPEMHEEPVASANLGKRKPKSEQKSKSRQGDKSVQQDNLDDGQNLAQLQVLLEELNSAKSTISELQVRLAESDKNREILIREKKSLESEVSAQRSLSQSKPSPSKKSKVPSKLSAMVAEVQLDNKGLHEAAFYKTQLDKKNVLLQKCHNALVSLQLQTKLVNAELHSTKSLLAQFSRQISFAINKRFTSVFTKFLKTGVQKSHLRSGTKERITSEMMAEPLAKKTLRSQKSLELNPSTLGNNSYEDSIWNEPEFIRARSFENLLAYVERKEREEGRTGYYSNNLILHNVNRDWDKPYGVLISNSAQATPLTGSNEKVPPGPEMLAHSVRKLESMKSLSRRSESKSPTRSRKDKPVEQSVEKNTGTKSGQRPRGKPDTIVAPDLPSTPFAKRNRSPVKANPGQELQSTARFGGEKPITFGKQVKKTEEKRDSIQEPGSEEFTLQGKQHRRASTKPHDGSRKDKSKTLREFRNLQKELDKEARREETSPVRMKKETRSAKIEEESVQAPLKSVVAKLRSGIKEDIKRLGMERDESVGRANSRSPHSKSQVRTPTKSGSKQVKVEQSPVEKGIGKRLRSREHSESRRGPGKR